MVDEKIEVEVIQDGGNPRTNTSIHQVSHNFFNVEPFSEDNDPNYKFRFEILATNTSNQDQNIRLHIKWNEPIYNKYRKAIYYRNNSNDYWVERVMSIGESSTLGDFALPPGENIIASQPAYSYGKLYRYLDAIALKPKIVKEFIGETAQKRKIHQIVLSQGSTLKKKRSIVVVCRIHPYETSGSYCAEGMINAIIDRNDLVLKNLENYRVHIIPMANPDGVYDGLCKRTAHDGIDLSNCIEIKDSTCSAIVNLLDYVQPDIYCELHNWMLPNLDGIYFLNRYQIYCLLRLLPKRNHKEWRFNLIKKIFARKPLGLKKYCKDRFGSIAFVLEFPWFNRSTADMRMIGAYTLHSISCL